MPKPSSLEPAQTLCGLETERILRPLLAVEVGVLIRDRSREAKSAELRSRILWNGDSETRTECSRLWRALCGDCDSEGSRRSSAGDKTGHSGWIRGERKPGGRCGPCGRKGGCARIRACILWRGGRREMLIGRHGDVLHDGCLLPDPSLAVYLRRAAWLR